MAGIFKEQRRVLKPDGINDCYVHPQSGRPLGCTRNRTYRRRFHNHSVLAGKYGS
jgi:hypothetical protein